MPLSRKQWTKKPLWTFEPIDCDPNYVAIEIFKANVKIGQLMMIRSEDQRELLRAVQSKLEELNDRSRH